jgi:hypothetical protein
VVVSPQQDASSTANGNALLAALGGISGATATEPRLLHIEPGTYDLGTQALQMKQHVDIQGSGEGATLITSANSGFNPTVQGENNSELRFLEIQNTAPPGPGPGLGIYNGFVTPRLTHVTVTSAEQGVHNECSSPVMTDVTISATGTTSVGVVNLGCSSPTIRDSVITAQGTGITNAAAQDFPTVRVDGASIKGTSATIRSEGERFTTLVGASQLDGGPVGSGVGSTTTCAGVYDENYKFSESACP